MDSVVAVRGSDKKSIYIFILVEPLVPKYYPANRPRIAPAEPATAEGDSNMIADDVIEAAASIETVVLS